LSGRIWATGLLAIALAAACTTPAAAQPGISISVTLELLPGVDVTAPAGKSGAPGDTIYYLFTLQNTGGLATSYRLSLISPAGWSVVLPQHSNKRVGVLQPGQSEIVPAAVTIASNAPLGSQGDTTLTATADVKPRPSDSDTVTTIVVAGPELPKMVTAPPPQSGPPGAIITYQFQLKNVGVTTADFRVSASSSPNWQTSLPNNPKGKAGPLAPGQVEMIPVVVRIPANAAIGATCKTTLGATCLARPRTSGEDSVTTTVVAPSALAVNLAPEASGDPTLMRWRVTISYQGAPRKVRLSGQSLGGWQVTVNGQASVELAVPAAESATELMVELRAPGRVRGEDCLIVSAQDGDEVVGRSAAVVIFE
jgi:hypothetical protein